MNLLIATLLMAASALRFWKAEPIGRAMRRMDRGRMQRDVHGLGGDARSYPFFVRMGSLMFGAVGLFAVIGQLMGR